MEPVHDLREDSSTLHHYGVELNKAIELQSYAMIRHIVVDVGIKLSTDMWLKLIRRVYCGERDVLSFVVMELEVPLPRDAWEEAVMDYYKYRGDSTLLRFFVFGLRESIPDYVWKVSQRSNGANDDSLFEFLKRLHPVVALDEVKKAQARIKILEREIENLTFENKWLRNNNRNKKEYITGDTC